MFEHEIWAGAVRGFFHEAIDAQREALAGELALHGEHPDRFVDATWRLFGVEADFDRLKLLARYTNGLTTNRRVLVETATLSGAARCPAIEVVGVKGAPVPERWRRRWVSLGGAVTNGRLIAMWRNPVLVQLSILGIPFPPFDPELDHELRIVGREDARWLGLLKLGSSGALPEIPVLSAETVESRLREYFGARVGAL
jgi:hypothetical protein